ncbi:MAG: TSUP family transporter [archaeon]|nr:TSUP family transporter [archaeon]
MIFEQIAAFFAGLIAMVYATFSGGGALVIVPALLFIGLAPAVAIATNRLAIFVASFGRLPKIMGKLNIGFKVPALMVACHTIGGIIGAMILISINPEVLFKIVGVLIILGALLLFFSPKGLKPAQRKDISNKSIALASIGNLVLGVYRGFFGPGAGTFGRIISTQVLGLDFVQSLSLATYLSLFSSLGSLIVFLYAGIVDFSIGIPLAIGAFIGAFFGTKIAIEKGNVFMKYSFVLLAIIFGGYFLFFR